MAERKNPGRFTVQFSMNDPQQQAAAELLERQGRRKAQFLTSAVLQYAQGSSGKAPDAAELEQIVRRILRENPTEPAAGDGAAAARRVDASQEAWSMNAEDESLSAISNTLAAFRRV